MGERKIVWEIDKFVTTDSSCSSRKNSNGLIIQPNFVAMIRRFPAENYSHLGVTASKKESVLEALNSAGLLEETVPHVLSGEEVWSHNGRAYRLVASRAGLESDEDVKSRMLIVGPQPTDIEGAVTIVPPIYCGGLNAVEGVADLLYGVGEHDFSRGFSRLYNNTEDVERRGAWLEQRFAQLDDGTRFRLNYCDKDGSGFSEFPRRFPVVEIV